MGKKSKKQAAAAKHHSTLVVCIAQSKCLTYTALGVAIVASVLCIILSLLPGQLSTINEANVANWDDDCTDTTDVIAYLTPFRYTQSNGNEMACPWPAFNIALRITVVSLILIVNGSIFGQICRYAEHEGTWTILRWVLFSLTAAIYAIFILDLNQIRIGSAFCESGGTVDGTTVLSVGECYMFEYYWIALADLVLVAMNGTLFFVMKLFLRVRLNDKKKKKRKKKKKPKDDDEEYGDDEYYDDQDDGGTGGAYDDDF